MQRLMPELRHAFEWNGRAFVRADLPTSFEYGLQNPARCEPACVDPARITSKALNRYASLMRIDPELCVTLVPSHHKWNSDLQEWSKHACGSIWFRFHERKSAYSSRSWSVVRIIIDLGAEFDPYEIIAHEIHHATLRQISVDEYDLLLRWGDFLRYLHSKGELFDFQCDMNWFDYDTYIIKDEEAEADSFSIWAAHQRLPFGLHAPEARLYFADRYCFDVSILEKVVADVIGLYAEMLAGRRTGRMTAVERSQLSRWRLNPFIPQGAWFGPRATA